MTAKSTTGWIFTMNGGPVSWASKRQSVVAQSSCEAEYYALNSAAREAAWIRNFMEEIGRPIDGPVELAYDNEGSCKLAYNPEYHQRTKHISVAHHYIR